MGANITVDGNTISISDTEKLNPLDLTVPADISSAAFVLVAAALLASDTVTLEGVGVNATRTGILDALQA